MEKLILFLRLKQWYIFSIVCGVTAIVLIAIFWPINSLYTSISVRADAQRILLESTEKYGLPKSDFFYAIAEQNYFRLCRRPHHRGKDNVTCDVFSVLDLSGIK